MRILFVGQNLNSGGIQRSLVNLLNRLSESYEIDLVIFAGGDFEKFLNKNIKIIKGNKILNLMSTPFKNIINNRKIFDILIRSFLMILVRILGSERLYSMVFKKIKLDKNYDMAVSYFNDVPNNYFNRGTNQFVINNVVAKKIAWIHTDPILAKFDIDSCKNTYRNFDEIVCVSNACKKNFISMIPEFKKKVKVVYNFFDIEEIKFMASENVNYKWDKSKINIVTVARIDNKSKRIDKIVEIVKLLRKEKIDKFKWVVIGDGPDYNEITKKCEEYGLNNFIELIGNKSNPYPYIKNSDLFVLTSDYEGFPMVVSEALILGIPILTTDYAAVDEQVENNLNAIVVNKNLDNIYTKVKEVIIENDKLNLLKSYIYENQYNNIKFENQIKEVLEEIS